MKFLRNFLDSIEPHFLKGGKLHSLEAFYEATDTVLFTPGKVTKGRTHVRDGLDLKRMMVMVVIGLLPAYLMAMYNTGLQTHTAIGNGALPLDNWQTGLFQIIGLGFDPASVVANIVHGALYFLPVWAMTFIVGGHVEMAFAAIRKHEVNEGFLVTGFLFPLLLPPTIPLWQVAMGVSFGVIIGKEVFGGTGMNVLNPALVGRAFLFFAYPAQISGDSVWIAANMADGTSGATMLSQAAVGTADYSSESFMDAFMGFIPGSMGETSTLALLLGAVVLVMTQIGSWRTMVGVVGGTAVFGMLFNAIGSETNFMFGMPWHFHFVLGGWALGAIFMATDPVSSAFTARGKFIYGFGIGALVVLVRVVNPAYPEGMMLAILFMNMFAPLIDHFIVQANIKRRQRRLSDGA